MSRMPKSYEGITTTIFLLANKTTFPWLPNIIMSQPPHVPKPPSPPRLSVDPLASPNDPASSPASEALDSTLSVAVDPAGSPRLKHVTRDIKQAKNTVVFHATTYNYQELLTERLDVNEGSWNVGGALDRETAQLLIRIIGEDKKAAAPEPPVPSPDSERNFQRAGRVVGFRGDVAGK